MFLFFFPLRSRRDLSNQRLRFLPLDPFALSLPFRYMLFGHFFSSHSLRPVFPSFFRSRYCKGSVFVFPCFVFANQRILLMRFLVPVFTFCDSDGGLFPTLLYLVVTTFSFSVLFQLSPAFLSVFFFFDLFSTASASRFSPL